MSDDSEPQFPLRDYFAAHAMQGYRAALACEAQIGPLPKTGERPWRVASSEAVARWAYDDARAMLAERAKESA